MKYETENYCDCDEVLVAAFDYDDFWAFKVGLVRCKCGKVMRPCNECWGTDITKQTSCEHCPWDKAAITDDMSEYELAEIADSQGQTRLEAMPVPYHIDLCNSNK